MSQDMKFVVACLSISSLIFLWCCVLCVSVSLACVSGNEVCCSVFFLYEVLSLVLLNQASDSLSISC